MATFYMTYNTTGYFDVKGSAQVMRGRGAVATEALTTSAASQIVQDASVSPTADWSAPGEGFVTMRADGAVWVHIDGDPVAASNKGYWLAADERFEIAVQQGDKVAVVDA